jgi:Rad3-related DNA helicase
MDNIENHIHLEEESFVVVTVEEEHENHLDLEKKHKKLLQEYEKLEKRHVELLKLMNELLKIKPSSRLDNLDNLDEIRQRITQILYNEMRRHTIFSFSPILTSYSVYPSINTKYDNLNVD